MEHNLALRALYSDINRRSIPIAQVELAGPTTYCRALWAIGNWHSTPATHQLKTDLKALQDEGVLFDVSGIAGFLHWTLFQLETFPVEPVVSEDLMNEGRLLQQIIYEYPPLEISFTGVSKTRFGLFLCGYPSYDINQIRNQIRRKIPGLKEPHPQDICHSTLFRFTRDPSPAALLLLEEICTRYADVPLYQFKPTRWEYGFGTWLQQERHVIMSWGPPPRWILHRGLKNGPDRAAENQESLLLERLAEGWDIEIDIWRDSSGVLWLGHDGPTTVLQDSVLLTHPRVWIHCKNLAALVSMPAGANYFFHDVDAATLTSQRYVWCYPGNQPGGGRDVVVLPERTGARFPAICGAAAVCSDYKPAHFL